VIFNTNRREGNAALYQCLVRDPGTGAVGTEPVAVEVCGEVANLNDAPTAEVEGAWVFIKNADRDNESPSNPVETTHQISTTGLGGKLLGFAVQHTPLNHAEGTPTVFADLTVNAVPSGNGDHPGCKGVENAYDQVTTNNGAAKGNGKGKAALEKVAEKLGCDIAAE
jgi:hypothetical protein